MSQNTTERLITFLFAFTALAAVLVGSGVLEEAWDLFVYLKDMA